MTGGAEQFYADAKAKESAEAAVVECAAKGVPQDVECFICKSSIEGKGIVRGCACRGSMGLAHVSCLVRQAQVSVAQYENEHTGHGVARWEQCFECGERFHSHVWLALGWAFQHRQCTITCMENKNEMQMHNRQLREWRSLGSCSPCPCHCMLFAAVAALPGCMDQHGRSKEV